MLKRLLFILLFLSALLFSKVGFSQCDIDYYVAGNPNNTCLVAGNDIQFDYILGNHFGWKIDEINGGNIEFDFGNTGSYTWLNPSAGTFIITVLNNFAQPICSETITIAPGMVSLSTNIQLSYCQWNTINLADTISTYYLQNGTNPQYTFTDIAGDSINGTAYYINNSGVTLIDVTVEDASGCTTSGQITIDAQANDINTQNYTISDTVVQFCSDTDIDFYINSPNTNFTYNWTIDGQPFYNTPTCQYTFSAISNYQGPVIFEIELEITDTNGCTVTYYDQVVSLGLDFPVGSLFSTPDFASPGCIYDSSISTPPSPSIYWPAIDNIPIIQMGPEDTIYWFIYCQNSAGVPGSAADIDTIIWDYTDLPSLIQPNPQDPNDPCFR